MTNPGYILHMLYFQKRTLPAARCMKCNAIIYPIELIMPHIARHGEPQPRGVWFPGHKAKLNKGGGRPKLKSHERKKGGANINRRGKNK